LGAGKVIEREAELKEILRASLFKVLKIDRIVDMPERV
jgi:hypothetical protein